MSKPAPISMRPALVPEPEDAMFPPDARSVPSLVHPVLEVTSISPGSSESMVPWLVRVPVVPT